MAPPFWLIGDSLGGACKDASPRLCASELRLDEPLLYAALFTDRLDEAMLFAEPLAESLGAHLASSREGGIIVSGAQRPSSPAPSEKVRAVLARLNSGGRRALWVASVPAKDSGKGKHGKPHSACALFLASASRLRIATLSSDFRLPCWVGSSQRGSAVVEDFPICSSGSAPPSPFAASLSAYLAVLSDHGCALSPLQDVLSRYDLRSAKSILLPSAPALATSPPCAFGQLALRAALSSLPQPSNSTLLYATPTLGSLTEDFLLSFVDSCRGAPTPPPAGAGSKRPRAAEEDSAALKALQAAPLRVLWPSASAVRDSNDGWHAAGCFGSDAKLIDACRPSLLAAYGPGAAPPRLASLCEAKSTAESSLVTAPFLFSLDADGKRVHWLVTGSAPLLPSAWGKLAASGGGKVNITEFHLSALITPQSWEEGCRAQAALIASGALRPSRFTVSAAEAARLVAADGGGGQPAAFLAKGPLSLSDAASGVALHLPLELPARPFPAPDAGGRSGGVKGEEEEEEVPFCKGGMGGAFETHDGEGKTCAETWPKHH